MVLFGDYHVLAYKDCIEYCSAFCSWDAGELGLVATVPADVLRGVVSVADEESVLEVGLVVHHRVDDCHAALGGDLWNILVAYHGYGSAAEIGFLDKCLAVIERGDADHGDVLRADRLGSGVHIVVGLATLDVVL